jgi:radical SAM superfamily enzyme
MLSEYEGKIALQCRPEAVNTKFLDAVEKVKGKVVLEFGMQTIHKEESRLIERPIGLRKTNRVTQECWQRGIPFEISLIYGLPNQTLQSFQESLNWANQRGAASVEAWPLMLLRGTALYKRKDELGLVEGILDEPDDEIRVETSIPHVVASPSFSEEDWRSMRALAM